MNELETRQIMTYAFADFRVTISDEQVKVWSDLLSDLDYNTAIQAVQLVIAKAQYLPRVTDILKAAAAIKTPENERNTWGEAWDIWVNIARRGGQYEKAEHKKQYEQICPIGAKALGTSQDEYYRLQVDDLNTFKAQFRMRYEALAARENHNRALPKKLQILLAHRKEEKSEPVKIGTIANQIVEALK